MLPNENLAEVFTFFELFDAGAVLLVSRHFADLAVKALRKIPVTRFHRIRLHEYDPELRIYASESRTFDALDEEIIVPVDLLHIAIRNCVIEELALSCMACTALEKSPACPVRAYLQASGKTAVTHCLELRASCFTSSSDLIEFLEPFHGLHVSVCYFLLRPVVDCLELLGSLKG